MGKGPGLYSDIGKRARDLLFKDYQSDHKFTITTYSPTGVAITSSGTKKGDLFLADVNTQLKNKNITTDIKVDTSSNLSTTVTVDEPAPGLKAIFIFKVPDQRSGKVELQYLHDYAGISTSIGLTANPIVNFAGVIGTNVFSLGSDLSFDTKTGNFTKCNAGLSYTNADLIASLTLPPKPSYLTGIRRVCSLEFRPHLMNSPDSGLADPLLGSNGSSGSSEHSFLPQSTIYNWSCGHFSKPLLTAAEDISNRREGREKFALQCIAKCQHSSVSKLNNNPIATWDTMFETGTKTILLQPFSPIVVAADENERIRVWNYVEPALLNSFDNHDFPEKGISKLCLVNELDDSLLLAASCDGNIRIWKDYTLKGRQQLVTAFSAIQGHRPGVRSLNAVVDWQQQSGYLYASGEISSIVYWDLDKELLLKSFPSSSNCSISALSSSQDHGGHLAAGFVDGSIRLYDVRTPKILVSTMRPHVKVERVVGIGFQPGLDPSKIVSASQAGDIQFLDIRNLRKEYLTIDAHRGSLTALAVHRHAPIIASGSAKQLIKVFSVGGEQPGTIRYHPTFMPQKIGSVSCLAFHPYEPLLAAGASDACVSIYGNDNSQA